MCLSVSFWYMYFVCIYVCLTNIIGWSIDLNMFMSKFVNKCPMSCVNSPQFAFLKLCIVLCMCVRCCM